MPASSKYSHFFFLITFLLLISVFYLMLRPFLVAVILAVTLASLFYPNFRVLKRKLGGYGALSSVIMCAIITFLIVIPLLLLFLALVNETNNFVNSIRQQDNLDRFLPGSDDFILKPLWDRLDPFLELEERDWGEVIGPVLDFTARFALSHYTSILGQIGVVIFNFFVMLFSMFFFFRDGDKLVKELKGLIPLAPKYTDMVFEKLRTMIYATFFGIFATGIAQGIVAGLVFFFFGVQNPILWGTATAFLSLLPIVGTAIVWVPMSVYFILSGSVLKGVLLLVAGGSVIGMVDNFVRPLIIEGTSKGLHLLLVFFSLTGGLLLFGPAGLVLGPLVVAMLVTFLDIYKMEFRTEAEETT